MTIIASTGSPQAIGGASGGKIYAYNAIGNVLNVAVAPVNPSRQRITFINPGATVTIYISPTTDANGATLTPTTAALGGTVPVIAGGFVTIDGECQCAWQALAASGGAVNPLTVMDSNV